MSDLDARMRAALRDNMAALVAVGLIVGATLLSLFMAAQIGANISLCIR